VIDARGRAYVGNLGYGLYTNEPQKPTNLLRVDPDRTIAEVAIGLEFLNAAAIINGGRTLVVNETWVGRVTAFDLTEDGRLLNRRLFADLGGCGPDDMCADAEGSVWVGCYLGGEILRVRGGGEIMDRFTFDGRGISCDLGCPDGRTLCMTAFLGPDEDVPQGKPLSALFSAQVEVPVAA